jgi:glycosyltransferase involved in cell wall biosynthesis
MKICYIADALVPSQTANSIHIMNMCQAYAFHGHRVRLIVPNRKSSSGKNYSVSDILTFYGVTVPFEIKRIWLPRIRSSWIYFCIIIPFLALVFRPQFIHTRSIGVAWGCSRIFRLKTIFELHNDPFKDPIITRYLKQLFNLPLCKGVVVITESLRRHILNNVSTDKPILVLADGVSSHKLNNRLSKSEARKRTGLPLDKKIALYAGSLYEGRGIEIVLMLATKFKMYDFYIIGGTTDQITYYKTKAGQVCANLHFNGFVDPAMVHSYLLASDILLMPYAPVVKVVGGDETSAFASPIKLFEYMAAGRPILSSTLPVLCEIIADKEDAFMVPYEQTEEWIKAFTILDNNPAEALKVSENAKRKVQNYTWERRAAQICDFILNNKDLS